MWRRPNKLWSFLSLNITYALVLVKFSMLKNLNLLPVTIGINLFLIQRNGPLVQVEEVGELEGAVYYRFVVDFVLGTGNQVWENIIP